MRLSSIGIQGFRSIAQADLAQCGALNVLIGKNNSGKSNILSAIQLVFDFLGSASLVATTHPPVSNATDWFQRDSNAPVIISASLQLTDAEMEKIRNAISAEAPQVKNALDDVSNITTIECQLTVCCPA
jgi:putative ATP-dependent endonuclease of the OLD family